VIKTRKIGFLAALVLVIAVATILITPDPTDDVDGLLRPPKVIKIFGQMSGVVTAAILSTLPSARRSYLDQAGDLTQQSRLPMICAYRC